MQAHTQSQSGRGARKSALPVRRLTQKLRKTANQYLDLRDRAAHPMGRFDNGGRWYPDAECDCCKSVRSPSRSYPYSLQVHQRTMAHIAMQTGYEAKLLRWAVKRIERERASDV